MSFFKNDNGELLEAPNFVLNANYELRAEREGDKLLIIDGWIWFETELEARESYNLLED